jgi:hypothetical protein
MRAALVLVLLLCACPAHQRPVAASAPATASAPTAPGAECASDADCALLTRASLGCCDPCPEPEAMSAARREEIEGLCGLHNGGETCPPDLDGRCEPFDPLAWRAACVAGQCRRVAAQ